MPPLSTVLPVIMTEIVSTLASLLQGEWHPGHTPTSQSALYPLLTDDMFLLDLLQELVLLLAPNLAIFLAVFSLLVQHCQQEAAGTNLAPWLVGWKLSASPSWASSSSPPSSQ